MGTPLSLPLDKMDMDIHLSFSVNSYIHVLTLFLFLLSWGHTHMFRHRCGHLHLSREWTWAHLFPHHLRKQTWKHTHTTFPDINLDTYRLKCIWEYECRCGFGTGHAPPSLLVALVCRGGHTHLLRSGAVSMAIFRQASFPTSGENGHGHPPLRFHAFFHTYYNPISFLF